MYNVAYRLVGERQDALDLTQEAFVRAYHALASFDAARPFGPWINRIVANLALNWLQHRRVPTLPLELTLDDGDESETRALPDSSKDPERVLLANERHQQLHAAILSLPAHYRAVIELRHFQDLSYDAIAATLNIPVSDVKSHLFRARQMLRKYLEAKT